MSTFRMILSRIAADRGKLAFASAIGLVLGYVGGLARMSLSHDLVLDTLGRPVLSDFVAFWTAGREALNGTSGAAYDIRLEHAAEVVTVGHPFKEMLGWSYPPLFLFAAAMLASLPYALAFLLWNGGTLVLHAGTVSAIARRHAAILFACAAPWALTCFMSGQNGFLTASLIASALLCLEPRPVLCGIFLGLLSYKPQFGVLFPLALAFGGYWRAFTWAAVSTILLHLFAGVVFGFGTFGSFLHALAASTQSHLSVNGMGWNKLESMFSLTRAFGGSTDVAWTVQVVTSVIAAGTVALIWRSRLPVALKAACLATAIPLVTPYVLVYDMPVLTVAGAFLFRQRAFDEFELTLLALAVPCVLIAFVVPIPTALLAILAVAAISVRRVLAERGSVSRLFGAPPQYSVRSP